jgi:hypothetical protein
MATSTGGDERPRGEQHRQTGPEHVVAKNVQIRKVPPSTIAGTPIRGTSALARTRTSPWVLRARKVAPCRANSDSVARPPSSAYGLSRVSSVPVYWWCSSSGTPCTMFANATPHSSAGTVEPPTIARSQLRRHGHC